MKKIISLLSIFSTNVIARAITVNGSIDGTPISISVGNAPSTANFSPIQKIIVAISNIIGSLVPVMISLAVLVFFWFLVQFIWKGADDPKVHQNGMKGMGYSLLAIFVMVSLWGIIAFVGTTLGIGQGGGMNDFRLPGFK